MTTRTISCHDRLPQHLVSRLEDFALMLDEEEQGNDEGTDELPPLNEYGLSFTYQEGTYDEAGDWQAGYWQYLLSWGGPSDELRFYVDTDPRTGEGRCYRVVYQFADWFDGAEQDVTRDLVIKRLVAWFEGWEAFTRR